MLHKDYGISKPEEGFFNEIGTSIIKTAIMFVGEIEFGDFPLNTNSNSWLSYVFLLVFVMLIIVVLMNLLNGLAVSDIGSIRNRAEIINHKASINTVFIIESMFFNNLLDLESGNKKMKKLLVFLREITGTSNILMDASRTYQISPSTRFNGLILEHFPNKVFEGRHLRQILSPELPKNIVNSAVKKIRSYEEQKDKEKDNVKDNVKTLLTRFSKMKEEIKGNRTDINKEMESFKADLNKVEEKLDHVISLLTAQHNK